MRYNFSLLNSGGRRVALVFHRPVEGLDERLRQSDHLGADIVAFVSEGESAEAVEIGFPRLTVDRSGFHEAAAALGMAWAQRHGRSAYWGIDYARVSIESGLSERGPVEVKIHASLGDTEGTCDVNVIEEEPRKGIPVKMIAEGHTWA